MNKVGVCLTKTSSLKDIIPLLIKTIPNSFLVKNIEDAKICNLLFVIGPPTKNYSFRMDLSSLNIPKFFVDCGIFKENSYIFGFNGVKGNAKYFLKSLNKYNYLNRMKTWRKDLKTSKRVLVLLHNSGGFCTSYGLTRQNVLDDIDFLVKNNSDYNFIFKCHPKDKSFKFSKTTNKPLDYLFEKGNFKCCVGWHTNACIKAIYNGIPCHILDENSLVYKYSTDIKNPKYFDRFKLFNDIFSIEWSIQTIKEQLNRQLALHNFI